MKGTQRRKPNLASRDRSCTGGGGGGEAGARQKAGARAFLSCEKGEEPQGPSQAERLRMRQAPPPAGVAGRADNRRHAEHERRR